MNQAIAMNGADGFVPAPGFEGRYWVNPLGDVMGRRGPMKPSVNNKGYKTVNLKKSGTQHMTLVHRLVALAFVPNDGELPHVNHINENKLDNRAENLEWCTPLYNANFGTRNKRHSQIKRSRMGRPMVKCAKDGAVISKYSCLAEVIDENPGYSRGNISVCLSGKKTHAYGFTWKYVDSVAS